MTLVATILTSSLVSSLVSTIVTNCWTTSKERKQFFRTKLEELFHGLPRLFQIACDCVLVSLDVGHEKDHDL
jgi:hypothetical protein